jgi:hypothetical protein
MITGKMTLRFFGLKTHFQSIFDQKYIDKLIHSLEKKKQVKNQNHLNP